MCVCVPDESMQKCFGEGSGLVYRDVLSWLQSHNTQLQLSGALAVANFARNGETRTQIAVTSQPCDGNRCQPLDLPSEADAEVS